jgi:hypothetical protein
MKSNDRLRELPKDRQRSLPVELEAAKTQPAILRSSASVEPYRVSKGANHLDASTHRI